MNNAPLITALKPPLPEQLIFQTPKGEKAFSFTACKPDGPSAGVLVLGHGAGAPMGSPFMKLAAKTFAGAGFTTYTFNFPYAEQTRRPPDPKTTLIACYQKMLTHIRQQPEGARPLLAGGKSMGGRVASLLAAEGELLDGLIYLGYPLHPQGKPEKLRRTHLGEIKVPQLFVWGTKDNMAQPELIKETVASLSLAELFKIEGGNHSLEKGRKAGITLEETLGSIASHFKNWVKENISST